MGVGLSTMDSSTRDDENLTSVEYVGGTVHDQFVLALEHVHDLLMRMLVLGQSCTRFDLPVDMRRMLGMDEASPVPGDQFAWCEGRQFMTISHQSSSVESGGWRE